MPKSCQDFPADFFQISDEEGSVHYMYANGRQMQTSMCKYECRNIYIYSALESSELQLFWMLNRVPRIYKT